MKKIIPLMSLLGTVLSCDPTAVIEATIINETNQNLTIVFVATDTSENLTLSVNANSKALFQDGFDIGSNYLEPNLSGYYIVQILDSADNIIKEYLPDGKGKNIFDVGSWNTISTEKRNFIYEFVITDQDLQ
jgi:hypothetical protein